MKVYCFYVHLFGKSNGTIIPKWAARRFFLSIHAKSFTTVFLKDMVKVTTYAFELFCRTGKKSRARKKRAASATVISASTHEQTLSEVVECAPLG